MRMRDLEKILSQYSKVSAAPFKTDKKIMDLFGVGDGFSFDEDHNLIMQDDWIWTYWLEDYYFRTDEDAILFKMKCC